MMWGVLKGVGRKRLRKQAVFFYRLIYGSQCVRAFGGVDLIHHIGQGSEMIGFAALQAARCLGVPFLVQPTIHPGQWGDSEIDFSLYRAANHLLVHTEYEQDYFKNHGIAHGVTVVGNGIEDRSDGDGNRFRERFGIRGPMILFVGRKSADKGYPLLVQAFVLAQGRMEKDTVLVCMGPGSTDRTKVPGIIELGFTDENTKHDALAACDLLCVPSEAESFGLIYMEAARYRKALLGRRLPVLQELLGLGNAASLVGRVTGGGNRVEISVDELTSEMVRLLSNSKLREEMGRKAYDISGSFLWDQIVCRFEGAYYNSLRQACRIDALAGTAI
jgi:glycosyltransferase involved in cell wall biosynthesis